MFLVKTRASHIPFWALAYCMAKDNLGCFIACLHLQSTGITRVHDHTWFCVALEVKSRALCGRRALCRVSSIPIPHQYTFKTQCMLQIHYLEKTSRMHLQITEYLFAVFCKSCKNILSAPSNTEKWRWGHALLRKQRSYSHICLDLLSASVNQHSAYCLHRNVAHFVLSVRTVGVGEFQVPRGSWAVFTCVGRKYTELFIWLLTGCVSDDWILR